MIHVVGGNKILVGRILFRRVSGLKEFDVFEVFQHGLVVSTSEIKKE